MARHINKKMKAALALFDPTKIYDVNEAADLVKKVSLELDGDDISAGLRLGQFVEDYGDFIAELQRSRVFGE